MSNGDALYWILRTALDVTVWGGELIADAELPTRDPAVFVANHAGSLGPIAVAATLPVRLHPWIIGDMVDGARAGPYLHKDFVKPDLRMPDALGMPFSTALSRITVPLLLRLGCIPVWQDRELLETIRISADALIANKSLLIFPEDPQLSINEGTGMRPFKTGFAHLGRAYYDRTGAHLRFYPVAVHRRRRRVQVADPIMYNPHNNEVGERRRVAHLLESIIAAMLAEGGGRLRDRVSAPS